MAIIIKVELRDIVPSYVHSWVTTPPIIVGDSVEVATALPIESERHEAYLYKLSGGANVFIEPEHMPMFMAILERVNAKLMEDLAARINNFNAVVEALEQVYDDWQMLAHDVDPELPGQRVELSRQVDAALDAARRSSETD
jgi:hypothetical protein